MLYLQDPLLRNIFQAVDGEAHEDDISVLVGERLQRIMGPQCPTEPPPPGKQLAGNSGCSSGAVGLSGSLTLLYTGLSTNISIGPVLDINTDLGKQGAGIGNRWKEDTPGTRGSIDDAWL